MVEALFSVVLLMDLRTILDWVWRNQSPYLGSCGQDHRIGPGVGLGVEESEPLPGVLGAGGGRVSAFRVLPSGPLSFFQ